MLHDRKAYCWDILAKLDPPRMPVQRFFRLGHTNHTTLVYFMASLAALFCTVGLIIGLATINWIMALLGAWLAAIFFSVGLMALAHVMKWQEE